MAKGLAHHELCAYSISRQSSGGVFLFSAFRGALLQERARVSAWFARVSCPRLRFVSVKAGS
jgi:hypothetical protein